MAKTKDPQAMTSPTTQASNGQEVKRTKCPVTRAQMAGITPIMATLSLPGVGDRAIILGPKAPFKTNSYGWHNNDKVVVVIDGVPCKVQVNCSLIVVGSKNAV
jgi:hypothetical protein